MSTASAQTILGLPLQPAALNEAIGAAVAAKFDKGTALWVRDLKKSLARNGHGYCGEVALAESGPFSPFQVILEPGGDASVLILSDADKADALVARESATALLKNAGCME
ncbi:hypothetical protein [Kaistia algarum]|uniref:hypothetical protein n=1 Tax=Kaistia algarum TaxID=2083279 RepID=UPI0022573618|nr:hypothetical protein [Kaistia algarum]MCX5516038.1 hypothetical protein [Kaistia algarum]